MHQYKSQIRDSMINELRDKVTRKSYGRYLVKMKIVHVRSLKNQTINFDFPVTALIGPNGGGKTTILGAAATAYSSIKPRQFFSKSGVFDESMADWRIEYDLIDREVNKTDVIRRTAAFHSSKWSRNAVDRTTVVLGVSRTVPASERKELQKCASGTFSVDEAAIGKITDAVTAAVEKILGKNIAAYSHIRVDNTGRVSLLTGATDDGTKYSEFHFGAGESSIIRMVMQVEVAPKNSLILVEEIENGLHPIATVRVVEYLIDAAHRNSLQAIFTTHSNDALLPLPPEAIWASIGGKVFQGKLDIASLRAITGRIEASLAIFCEDEFAAAWIRAVLRAQNQLVIAGVEVHPMAGDGTAVSINRHHNHDPAVRFPSLCMIDGDSRQAENGGEKVYRLPGQVPEAHVFDKVLEADGEHGRLIMRLHQPFGEQVQKIAALRAVRAANRDPHLIFQQVAEAFGYMSLDVVREAFFTTWVEAYPAEAQAIVAPILHELAGRLPAPEADPGVAVV
ncbi:AAA family ATPase [Lysobacter sp. Root690]|uniref:ATP-dependent nuclease n=1 Tax=Lysobacter sp. Root690 TaxID=1736588 RepID=UPI0009EA869E|nr:AAA family ATPase [Lysobacter sp. Root690]